MFSAVGPGAGFENVVALKCVQFSLRGDVIWNEAVYLVRIKRSSARRIFDRELTHFFVSPQLLAFFPHIRESILDFKSVARLSISLTSSPSSVPCFSRRIECSVRRTSC